MKTYNHHADSTREGGGLRFFLGIVNWEALSLGAELGDQRMGWKGGRIKFWLYFREFLQSNSKKNLYTQTKRGGIRTVSEIRG